MMEARTTILTMDTPAIAAGLRPGLDGAEVDLYGGAEMLVCKVVEWPLSNVESSIDEAEL